MARRVETRLVDDLDGGAAAATVQFALDGHSFEIDLSEGNLAELRTALEPFVRAARQVAAGATPRRPAPRSAPAPAEPTRSAEPTPPAAPDPEVVVAAGTPSRPERQRAPLVADPFNQGVRAV